MSMGDIDFMLFNGIGNGEDDIDSVVLEVGGEVENFDFEFDKFVNVFLMFGFYEFGDQVMFIIILDNIGFLEVIGVQVKDIYLLSLVLNDVNWMFNNGIVMLNNLILSILVDGSVSVNIIFIIVGYFMGMFINNVVEI